MEIQTTPLRKRLNVSHFHSDLDKPIPTDFITFEEFSKKLDDKITTHYEKLPDSCCSTSN